MTTEERNEIADELQSIKDEIKDAMDRAHRLVTKVGGSFESRAKSYWYPHIVMALDDDHGYVGNSMATMQNGVDELRDDEE